MSTSSDDLLQYDEFQSVKDRTAGFGTPLYEVKAEDNQTIIGWCFWFPLDPPDVRFIARVRKQDDQGRGFRLDNKGAAYIGQRVQATLNLPAKTMNIHTYHHQNAEYNVGNTFYLHSTSFQYPLQEGEIAKLNHGIMRNEDLEMMKHLNGFTRSALIDQKQVIAKYLKSELEEMSRFMKSSSKKRAPAGLTQLMTELENLTQQANLTNLLWPLREIVERRLKQPSFIQEPNLRRIYEAIDKSKDAHELVKRFQEMKSGMYRDQKKNHSLIEKFEMYKGEARTLRRSKLPTGVEKIMHLIETYPQTNKTELQLLTEMKKIAERKNLLGTRSPETQALYDCIKKSNSLKEIENFLDQKPARPGH